MLFLFISCDEKTDAVTANVVKSIHSKNNDTDDTSTSEALKKTEELPSVDQQTKNINFYISKLKDKSYVGTYGGEHRYEWFTAAEELGMIGLPAIPALIENLKTTDPYELMLSLYALMLASQDKQLMSKTGGEYINLETVLEEKANTKNKQIALKWWDKYQHIWK